MIRLSAATGEGIDAFAEAVANHRAFLDADDRLSDRRSTQEKRWIEEAVKVRFGTEGLRRARALAVPESGPFTREAFLATCLTGG